MADYDLTALNSLRLSIGTAEKSITLNPQCRYDIYNDSAAVAYFSTDGSSVVASDTTDAGGGKISKAIGASVLSSPIRIAGVSELRVVTASGTALLTITRSSLAR